MISAIPKIKTSLRSCVLSVFFISIPSLAALSVQHWRVLESVFYVQVVETHVSNDINYKVMRHSDANRCCFLSFSSVIADGILLENTEDYFAIKTSLSVK